ncbi:Protein CBG17778 [Caenorhabditis briggsae]|uniref:Protein CBG17778 n=1 Tax=Caenorhabditis briggsae TaxID=6238 RepID=A8XRS4_CAEBR|nr:Protein CBG17778 [Caenorhabditis briggsae]CAP35349.2 Protein CBG17778 [Caenorhabditis briggsae]
MTIVVKTPAGSAFTSLVAFLAEKQMEFAVTNDGPVADSEASNAPQASEEEPHMVRGSVKREEPEIDAPPNMERVARNKRKNLAYRNQPQTSEDQSRLPTKRIKREKPEVEIIIPNEELGTPKVENASSSEAAESMEMDFPDVEEEMGDLEEQPVSDKKSSSSTKMIECRLCNKKVIKSNSFYHKVHAAAHLCLKTWKCTVCETMFAQSASGKPHFLSIHPGIQFVPLVRTITEEDEEQLRQLVEKCFPSARN